MICKFCQSTKMVAIQAKCEDTFTIQDLSSGKTFSGYVPKDLGMGGGDYIRFKLCLACKRIQSPMLTPQEIDILLDNLFIRRTNG